MIFVWGIIFAVLLTAIVCTLGLIVILLGQNKFSNIQADLEYARVERSGYGEKN